MDRIGNAPQRKTMESPTVDRWFKTVEDRLNVYQGASDPVVAEIPENQWIVYNNTTLSEVRIWTNIAGALLKSAAFT